jgi:hypothetical protein
VKPINAVVVILNGLSAALCVLLYIGSVIIQPGDGGRPATAGDSSMVRVWLACLFAYDLLCFATGFARRRGRIVLGAGIVAHMVLAVFVGLPFTDGKNGPGEFLFSFVFSAIYAAVWWRMYFKLGSDQLAPAAFDPQQAA